MRSPPRRRNSRHRVAVGTPARHSATYSIGIDPCRPLEVAAAPRSFRRKGATDDKDRRLGHPPRLPDRDDVEAARDIELMDAKVGLGENGELRLLSRSHRLGRLRLERAASLHLDEAERL